GTAARSRSRARTRDGRRRWPARWSADTRRAKGTRRKKAARRKAKGLRALVALLHRRLQLRAERLARGVARVEHVTARIDHELGAIRRGKGWQLIELDPRAEIRRRQIEQPVHHQDFQLRVEREDLPEMSDRLRRIQPAAEI